MKSMKFLSILIIVITCFTYNTVNGQTRKTSFLIIKSTKNYNSALKKAQVASNKLGWTLNLNGNYKDKKNGLTNSDICDCGVNHGYIPRGRYDAGNYVSIEFSSAYEGFTKGYYIVVVSSGEREKVQSILAKVQKHYIDAYIKDTDIYVGCMH